MFICLSLHYYSREGNTETYLEHMQVEDSFLTPIAFPLVGPSLVSKPDDPPYRSTLIPLALGNQCNAPYFDLGMFIS